MTSDGRPPPEVQDALATILTWLAHAIVSHVPPAPDAQAIPTTNEPRILLPIADAARALSIGRTKMFELIASGDVPTVEIGRRKLVPVNELHAFVALLRAHPDEPRPDDEGKP
jgi:hypothetical protein